MTVREIAAFNTCPVSPSEFSFPYTLIDDPRNYKLHKCYAYCQCRKKKKKPLVESLKQNTLYSLSATIEKLID